jgi:methionine-rich copper-binding protein CopC
MFRNVMRLLLLLWVAFLALHLPPRMVSAHADYDRSEPAADALVERAPVQVRIWFTQELFRRQGINTLAVVDAAGQRVDQDDAAIDDDDRTLMTVTLAPDLPNGLYTVRWQAVSVEDGHESQGEFTFTVGDSTPVSEAVVQAEASPTTIGEAVATALSTAAPTSTVAAPSLPCLGGIAPLLFVLGGLFVRRRGM